MLQRLDQIKRQRLEIRERGQAYDIAHQARAVAIRVHRLYPALVRAQARLSACERYGRFSGPLRNAGRRSEIGRRSHPCLQSAVENGRPERATVARLTEAIVADAFAVRPWPAYADMRAMVYWVVQDDLDARIDVRVNVANAEALSHHAAALIEVVWARN